MNKLPSPAIVSSEAVRRLPRLALLLLSLAYVLPGFIGRDPWKNADLSAFGYMLSLLPAGGGAGWLHPQLMGAPPEGGALLPYWLGAWAMQALMPWGVPAELAARVPYVLMLTGALAATWYAVCRLARLPGAQPVAFAFGGEAQPRDYSRALADGALLALIATLGLAQYSHEITPATAQLFFAALVFYGMAALPTRPRPASVMLALGLPGLTLSGAPVLALVYAVLGLRLLPRHATAPTAEQAELAIAPDREGDVFASARARHLAWALLSALAVACLYLGLALGLLPVQMPAWRSGMQAWSSLVRMVVWFTWPVWPLALWTLWRWRRQLLAPRRHRYLGLPLLMAGVPLLACVFTQAGNSALLPVLPALAALAAFALPTFKRSMAALVDWFTLLFFTGWAIVIWVVWVAMQTGVPAKPAANVAKLAPGFEPVFQWPAFAAALLGTLAWLALVRWRTGRHRTALWKSLVLPAAGTVLCWLLLMTLWLPALNYGRSYAPQIQQVRQLIGAADCVQVHGLSTAHIVAVQYHGGWRTVPASAQAACAWLLADADALPAGLAGHDAPAALAPQWQTVARVPRPTDKDDTLLVLRRVEKP